MIGTRPVPTWPPPSIAVELAINPPSFKLGESVQLSVTAVSNASDPITIYTWSNILEPVYSQMRGSLVAFDQNTNQKLHLHTLDVSRLPINFTLGSAEDHFFVTLEPGRPSTFNADFVYNPYGAAVPGHRYLVDLQEGENVQWWKKGRKEDVLNLPGNDRQAYWADGDPIILSLDEPVGFKLLPLDSYDDLVLL